jgi:hypothetical protein
VRRILNTDHAYTTLERKKRRGSPKRKKTTMALGLGFRQD